MDAGTYEVLRDRLRARGAELARRAEALDAARTAEFGTAEVALAASGRLRTGSPGTARDLVAVGDVLLLLRDAPAPLSPASVPGDVFALYGRDFEPLPEDAVPGLLDDPAFVAEFAALCRFFQGARPARLRLTHDRLLAVFHTGKNDDVRVLRWQLAPLRFLDGRGERDLAAAPPPGDVVWTPTSRDDHTAGPEPRIRVTDGVYVSTVGGTLTVHPAADGSEAPDALFTEPVAEPLQSLADADVSWARVGPLVLLRVRPYNETVVRHLVVHTLTASVTRLEGVGTGEAIRRLPDDQGIVFPGGYCPAGGAVKAFEDPRPDAAFERAVRSPGGESVLYAFRPADGGPSVLLPYDTIRKEVVAPLACGGWALLGDGTIVVLAEPPSAVGEPTRTHEVRVWTSPYVSDDHPAPEGTGPLARIGNAALVRAVADVLAVAGTAVELDPAPVADETGTHARAALYEALAADCERTADRHPWLGDPEAGDLRSPLEEIRVTAVQALEEFATVRELTRRAAGALADEAAGIARLVRRVRGESPGSAEEWIVRITELRAARGRLLALKELRYADTAEIDALAEDLTADTAAAARRAVAFLGRDEAFDGYRAEIGALGARAAELTTAAEAAGVVGELDGRAAGLRELTEVVAGLDIADTTVRTGILERIAAVTGLVNGARAVLVARRRELAEGEGRAEFAAELALLAQSVTGALAAAGTPEECDEQLAGLLLRLENLESRFPGHEDFLTELAGKRTEVYEAFSARRQSLHDERARRTERLAESARRVLDAVARRASALSGADELHAFFGSDPMVARLRRTVTELREFGDSVRAEELAGRLKAARDEAVRALRDRRDLFGADGGTIRLGRHTFAVTAREPELTLVPDGDGMVFALTGTDWRGPVRDPGFAATAPYWGRSLASESPGVYRAEYLAARLLPAAVAGGDPAELVARAVAEAFDEGYERGVHDRDAVAVLRAAAGLWRDAGLLRYGGGDRAVAQLFWVRETGAADRARWTRQAESLIAARDRFGASPALAALRAELAATTGSPGAAAYLVEELALGRGFVVSPEARELVTGFREAVGGEVPYETEAYGAHGAGAVDGVAGTSGVPGAGRDSAARLGAVTAAGGSDVATGPGGRGAPGGTAAGTEPGGTDGTGGTGTGIPDGFGHPSGPGGPAAPGGTDGTGGAAGGGLPAPHTPARPDARLVEGWLAAYAESTGADVPPGVLAEAVALELCPELPRYEPKAPAGTTVEGLLGTHPRITGGALPLRLDEFLSRTAAFAADDVPGFRAYRALRSRLVDAERDRLRLAEYRPRVMSAFVRNRLVDEVYLPLVGDSLAKQIGAAGDARRTDSGGLLLLLSPPGYGKTTLVEYVAERLGLLLVKVDGPALGRDTVSLDPGRAPDAAARAELEKIAFAVAAGNNVLLYLDDIQHTSPELLQKFLPLCDASRTLGGRDLRGKRFGVVMAGNPYTEAGERFRLPDMLANRADVWNLGDVLTGKESAFALSFVENALTSHPELAPLAGRDRSDVELLVRLASGDPTAVRDRLTHPYGTGELDRILAVLGHLLTVRATVLAVNAAYIASAGVSEASRTEPPFRLQGSYRNLNRIAQRLSPAMTAAEVAAVVGDHYTAEAQTLPGDTEASLLRLAELRGTLDEPGAARWAAVKSAYVTARARERDPFAALTDRLAERLTAVERAIARAADSPDALS
ncbi:DNA repair ATPase [Streptomyces sp. NPDC006798]|uniref:DNA repair ATPase n=1 Tax=Streptomyces sp. NPDC006798 TaxID=3155462 RepID=UPI0033E77D47